MIEIQHLNKAFENHVIFHDFNLTIENGEFVVLTGKSGCGKTTLLNMIGGLEKPDAGSIIINGMDIHLRKNQKIFFQQTAGLLFQQFALVDHKTVRENMELIYKKSRSDVSIEDALDRVGLKDKIDTKVFKLSGGEQQRIALARLMIKQCSIILADEPTGALDRGNAQVVLQILQELQQMGKTVIMVTHAREFIKYGTRNVEL